jgi:hypothetical protein
VNGPAIILVLKVAVLAVTMLLLASLVALVYGKFRLHGRINQLNDQSLVGKCNPTSPSTMKFL